MHTLRLALLEVLTLMLRQGGQNVNKVNTKAEVRFVIDEVGAGGAGIAAVRGQLTQTVCRPTGLTRMRVHGFARCFRIASPGVTSLLSQANAVGGRLAVSRSSQPHVTVHVHCAVNTLTSRTAFESSARW